MKKFFGVLFGLCTIIWIYNLVIFIQGNVPSKFDIGVAISITILFFLRATIDEFFN